MPRDGSGNYTLPAGNPVVAATIIDIDWANPTMSDIAAQLNNVFTRDGVLGALAAFKFVDGSAANPGATFNADTTTGLWRAASSAGYSYAGAAHWTSTASLLTFNVQTSGATARLTSTTDLSLSSTGHALQIGASAAANLAFDTNEIMARNNGATATLNFNLEGGNVFLGDETSTVTVPGTAAVRLLAVVGQGSTDAPTDPVPSVLVRTQAISTLNTPTDASLGLELGWEEAVGQDLGSGEGKRIDFTVSLTGDAGTYYRVGSIWSSKNTTGDASRISDLVLGTSVDGTAAPTERLRVTTTGVEVTGDITATNFESGTYTPTGTPVGANVSSVTPNECRYMRIGNVVSISGSCAVDPVAAGGLSWQLTYPVGLEPTLYVDFSGLAVDIDTGGTAADVVTVEHEAFQQELFFIGTARNGAAHTFVFNGQYKV